MTEDQINAERLKLKANVNFLRLQLRVGKATQEELQLAEKALAQFKETPSATLKQVGQPHPLAKNESPWTPSGDTLAPHVATIVEELRKQQAEIDFEKRSLSMQLQAIPPHTPCPELTKAILALREKWMALGDDIRYVVTHGERPQEASTTPPQWDAEAYRSQLPTDRYTLSKMIDNLSINVRYKWPKRMAQTDTLAKKAEYQTKISKGEIELSILQQQFNALK